MSSIFYKKFYIVFDLSYYRAIFHAINLEALFKMTSQHPASYLTCTNLLGIVCYIYLTSVR